MGAPSMIPGKPYEEALSVPFASKDLGLDLGLAFAFSSVALLTSHRARTGGVVSPKMDCADFVGEQPSQPVATAVLFANDVDGGETMFPALGLIVSPKRGRLLVYTSMTSSGVCDPMALTAEAPLTGVTDKL